MADNVVLLSTLGQKLFESQAESPPQWAGLSRIWRGLHCPIVSEQYTGSSAHATAHSSQAKNYRRSCAAGKFLGDHAFPSFPSYRIINALWNNSTLWEISMMIQTYGRFLCHLVGSGLEDLAIPLYGHHGEAENHMKQRREESSEAVGAGSWSAGARQQMPMINGCCGWSSLHLLCYQGTPEVFLRIGWDQDTTVYCFGPDLLDEPLVWC